MAYANRYKGNELVVQWIWSGGTVTVTGDQTKYDVEESIDMLKVTAGNAADHEYIPGVADGSIKMTFFDTGTGGTALLQALKRGNGGTILWGPQGTAAGKPKGGFYAFVKSRKKGYPNADPAEIEVEWQKSGAVLFDDSAAW